MNRWYLNSHGLISLWAAVVLIGPFGRARKSFTNPSDINPRENRLDGSFQAGTAKQAAESEAQKKKQEEAQNYSSLAKAHVTNGNNAMQEAQALRKQVDSATGGQRTALLAKMNADYRAAIAEYQEALKDTRIGDQSAVKVLGLIGVIRNGLVTKDKAVEMLVQDKNLPIILSNLGYAYDGAGEYDEAITTLGQAATLRPAAGTYMQLGTDLAQVGKIPEAAATCDKVLAVDPTAKDMQEACYKNIAIVLTNQGKMADAIAPLQKATQLGPDDALAWKLLGDALSNTITAAQENGKTVYTVPPGTMEAYQKYLQLEPNGPYAAQVKATLEGLAQLNKSE